MCLKVLSTDAWVINHSKNMNTTNLCSLRLSTYLKIKYYISKKQRGRYVS